MKSLYEIEHKFLPMLVLGGKEKVSDGIYNIILHNFSSLCMEVAQSVSEKDNPVEFLYVKAMEEEFKVEQIPVKYFDGVEYKILKLHFYFSETPEFTTLCPHAYVVLSNVNGKNVYRYFTVEFDAMVDDEEGRGSYWLCGWTINSDGNLIHMNYGQVKLDNAKEISKILNKVVDKEKVNSKTSSSTNMSGRRVEYFYAPPGWEEDMKRREEQYEKQKQAEEVGGLIYSFLGIGVILYMIYLFCK